MHLFLSNWQTYFSPKRILTIVFCILLLPLTKAEAVPYYWRTGALTLDWQNAGNWSTVGHGSPVNAGTFPGTADEAIFGAPTPSLTLTNLPATGVGFITASAYAQTLSIPSGQTLLIVGTGTTFGGTSVLDIQSGAILRIANAANIASSGAPSRIRITGVLDLVGNAAVTGTVVQYNPGGRLIYSGAGSRTTTSIELPSPMNGMLEINKSLATETITLGAGSGVSALTITQGIFDLNGFTTTLAANSSIAANGTLTANANLRLNAGITLANSGVINVTNAPNGQIHIDGNAAISGTSPVYAVGTKLYYWGTVAKTVGVEFPNPMNGDVQNANTNLVTMLIPTPGTTVVVNGNMIIDAGATFVINPTVGVTTTFQHNGSIDVNGTLRIQETLDLRAGVNTSFVNVNANGRLRVQGQATASSVMPGTQSIIYANNTSILEFVSGASTAAFGTVGTNHLIPASMPGSIVYNATNNLILDGGTRTILGGFTCAVGSGFLTMDATTDLVLQGNIALQNPTLINFSNVASKLTINGAGTITGALGALTPPLNLQFFTMNRAGQTFTFATSVFLNAGALNVQVGTLALSNAGTVFNTGAGANTIAATGSVAVNAGTTFKVRGTTGLQNNGTVFVSNIGAGGTLECEGDNNPNFLITGAGAFTFAGANAKLNYTGGTSSMVWEAGPEFPSPMAGTVNILKAGSATVFITSTKTMTGPMNVQSGYCAVTTAGGNLTFGAGSQVQSGAVFQAGNNATVSGGANLTVQPGGEVQIFGANTWTGTPTYSATAPRGTLSYYVGAVTTGQELPSPTMNGNLLIANGANITLGATTQINGSFTMSAMPGAPTFTVPSPRILTLVNASNTIGPSAVFSTLNPAGELIISGAGNLTNNSSNFTIDGILTLDGTGVYNPASTNSPNYVGTGMLRYTGTNPTYTTGLEFPSSPASLPRFEINRAVATNTVILQNGKIITLNSAITQGVLQTSAVGASLNHTLSGSISVAANCRLRIQENSTITGPGFVTYPAAASTLEYAGTTLKAVTGLELPTLFGGSIIMNNSGGVQAPASLVDMNVAGSNFTMTSGLWKIPAGGHLQLRAGVGYIGGGAASYIETTPSANGNDAKITRNLNTAANWHLGSGGVYRLVATGMPSVATDISLGYANVSPTGTSDNAPFVGSATSPAYWYASANPIANMTMTLNHPSITATSKVGSYTGANAGGAYSNVPVTSGAGTTAFNAAFNLGAVPTHFVIGTGPVNTSDIIAAAPPYAYISPIDITTYNAAANLGNNVTATSVSLFEFDVRDNGGDSFATIMTSATLTVNDAAGNLRRIALYDGATELAEVPATNGTFTFAGFSTTIPNATTKRLALHVTFNDNVTDNSSIGFTVNSALANGVGSGFAAFAPLASSVAGNNNRISVVATQLAFPNAVGNQVVNTNFSPAVDVRAVDVNNNLDLDAAGTMTLTGAPIPVSAGGSVVLVAGVGVGTFSALQMASAGAGNILTATLGPLTGVSAPFNVTTIPVYWGCTIPSTPPALPVLPIGGRNMNFSSVSLNGGGNSLTNVATGASITLTGNWNMSWPGGVYCPGCVVQMYVGIGSGSGFAGNGSSATGFTYCVGSGVYNGSSGSMSYAFNAPTKPGIYYITQNWSLHYYCNPHPITFSNTTTSSIAVIQVIDPTPPSGGCNEADIVATPGFTYQANIPYASYTGAMSGTHPAVWSFRIRDFGTIPTQGDIDNKPTQITSIGVNVTDVGGVLQEIALYNGMGLIETQPVSGTGLVTFSSPAVAANLIALDDGVTDIIIRARFRTTPLTPPMDNRQFSFTINAANVTMAANAVSTQKNIVPFPSISSTNVGNDNRVVVIANQSSYTVQPPASTPVGVSMTAPITIRAEDANSNIDLDYNTPFNISHPRLIGSPIIVPSTSGVATFTGLTFNSTFVNGVLNESSGVLTTTNSASFDITPATFHFTQASGNANLVGNWQLNGVGANPAALGLSGATYLIGAAPAPTAIATTSAPLTINNGSTFQINNSSILEVGNGQSITNDGTLSVQANGTLRLIGSGVVLGGSANDVIYAATTATLEYAGPVALPRTTTAREMPAIFNGRLLISRPAGGGTQLTFNSSKTIAGAFEKSGAGDVIIDNGYIITVNGGTHLTAGNLTVDNTAQLIANGNTVKNGANLFTAANGSFTMNGAFTNTAGNFVSNSAVVSAFNGETRWDVGTLNLAAAGGLIVSAGGSFTLLGGSVQLSNTGVFTCNGAFANPSGNIAVGSSSLILSANATFGGGGFNSAANAGVIRILGAGTLAGTFNNVSPGYGTFELNRAGQTLSLAPGNLITNNLQLTNGIIQTAGGANYVSVLNTLTAMGGVGTYIDGKLRWRLAAGAITPPNTFLFPVGKSGNYLPFSYIDITANNIELQVEAMVPGSGGMSGPLFSSISTTEYWQTIQIAATSFTNTRIRLGRTTPVIQAAGVVGRSATQTGMYSGLGGAVGGGTVTSVTPDVNSTGFYSIGSLPNVFYYFSGPAELPGSWNSDIAGAGAPAIDFISPNTTFIVPNTRDAVFTNNALFGTVNLLINGGGKITVRQGRTLTASTIFRIAAGGQLVLVDSAKVIVPSRINYLDPTAELVYDSPNPNRIATLNEFGRDISASDILMAGSVRVRNGSVRLDTTLAYKNFTIQGSLALQNSTLDFGKDSVRLRLEGAISFNPSAFKTNSTHSLTIAGTGAITDSNGINFTTKEIGRLIMQRPNVELRLGDSLLVRTQLGLQNGVITPALGRALILTNSHDTSLVGGSFSSFVNGTLIRELPPNLTPINARSHFYPIGKNGTYLPLTLLNATTGTASPWVAAEAFNVGAGGVVAFGINGALSSSEHWRVQPVSGSFIGAEVGVMRLISPFTANHTFVSSSTKTGAYSLVPSALTPIAQGTSLLGQSVRITSERFFSSAIPVMGSPRITGFSPSIGGEQTVMTITGVNLQGVNAVAIGGFTVQQFTVVNSTTITVTVGAAGTGPVQIGSPNGGAASDSIFTFVPAPMITNILPNPAGLGAPITINGVNFGGTGFISIGGVQIPTNRFTVSQDGLSITTTVPLNAANTIVTIATFGGTAISTNALVLIPPPQISSISPQSASTGQTITLFGQNFVGVRFVRVGSSTALFTVNSPTRITLTVPARATTNASSLPITVVTGSGTATSATLFAYSEFFNNGNTVGSLPQTAIIGILDRVTTLGGRVRITGANLELIQEIRLTTSIASTTASWSLSSSAALTLIIPTNGLLNGTNATLSSAATSMDVLGAYNRVIVNNAFLVIGQPRILTVQPVDANPGEEITLTGTGLDLLTSVTIGGTNATFRIIDSSRVVVIMPFRITADSIRIPASGPLQVTSFGGGTATAPIVVNQAIAEGQPVITSFTPTSGVPGTEIIISGINFTSVRDVSVNGIPVASFVINSPTRITAVLSTTPTQRAQGAITLQTPFGAVNSRALFAFPSSLESDLNAANTLVALLGGDPSKIETQTVNNRITVLRLPGAGLRGPVPQIISTLTELRELDLSNNLLEGQIPQSLAALTKLERINLSNNRFSGVLPAGVFCSYNNLRFMDVSRNNLSGEIPVCITDLDRIEHLNLSYNLFTSLLPWQLGKMVSLTELRVSNNRLNGALPAELGTGGVRVQQKSAVRLTRTPTIQVIDVSNNEFSGGIPEEWGQIPLLRELRAENAGLTGVLPQSIRNWQGIGVLRLSNNRLTGTIPDFFAGSLREFVINNNRLTGALPESFDKASGLQILNVANNRLTKIPSLITARRLDTAIVDSNRLEFSSLESIANVRFFSALGQDSTKGSDNIDAVLGEQVRLSSGIGGAFTRYQWLRNGFTVRGATGATLVISSMTAQEVGSYICRASNSLVPNITIFSQAVRVSLTGATQALAVPQLQFPTNAATNIAPRPLLRWLKVPLADSYTVIIARDAALRQDVQSVIAGQQEQGDSVVLAWGSTSGNGASRGLVLERGVQYFWAVRAATSLPDIASTWSDTLSFRIVPFGQDLAFSSVNLGRVTIGDSARATGTVVNISDDAVTLESAQVESGMAGVFGLNLRRLVLPKDATTTFEVLFKPDRVDTMRANVLVRYSDARGQGSRTVTIDRALIGRGSALAIETLNFDTVRVGRSYIQSMRLVNRSQQRVVIRNPRIVLPRGLEERVFELAGRIDSLSIDSAGVAFIPIRCQTTTRGLKVSVLELEENGERRQTDVRAFARLERPDDAAVSIIAVANPESAIPGAAVSVELQLTEYSSQLAQNILNAAQPNIRLTVRFDRQVLIPDGNANGARLQRGTADSASVVVLTTTWEGRSRLLASIPFRAVAGSRTVSKLEVIDTQWGNTVDSLRAEWERKVFVEEPRNASISTFRTRVSQAGGTRLIASNNTSSATNATLALIRPNPATESIGIIYRLFDSKTLVAVDILNLKGEVVQTLVSENRQDEGEYPLAASIRGLSSGSYLVRLRADRNVYLQRFDVVR